MNGEDWSRRLFVEPTPPLDDDGDACPCCGATLEEDETCGDCGCQPE